MPLFYQVVSFNHPTKLFNFYVYASALPWLELVWLTSNQPVWLKQKKHEQSQTNSYWESTGRSNMIVHFFYCKNCRPLLGLLNLLSQYKLGAHNSMRPILLLLNSYQICWILPCAWYKRRVCWNLLTCLMSYGALFCFPGNFTIQNLVFFFIALLLATVKAFGKNMADSWVAHDIFHSSIAYQRDQTVKIGLLSLDKCSSPWTYSPTTSGTIAHIMAK